MPSEVPSQLLYQKSMKIMMSNRTGAIKMRTSLEILNEKIRRIDEDEDVEAGAKSPVVQHITIRKPPANRQASILNDYGTNESTLMET